MSLYHPISRASSQRDFSGTITPTNLDHFSVGSKKESITVNSSIRDEISNKPVHSAQSIHNRKSSILSPPLSPYQKVSDDDDDHEVEEPVDSSQSSKVYIPLKHAFKIENFKEYDLKVNPWANLNSDYKSNQFRFLEQYSIISSKERQTMKIVEKRSNNVNRKRISSSDSDSELERVRTRRIVKESSANLSEFDNARESTPTTPPKKRKVTRKEPYAGSPLAVQQAALIDENIPDYSPDPAATLPKGNNRCLKVEWKGQPMDLRFDRNIEKLHPAEVLLASILRLPCNVYLDSKRRLFFEKVNRLKKGQQFRRTDAQKACRIDVNKASRLFAAFEKVGWLEDDHFAKYL